MTIEIITDPNFEPPVNRGPGRRRRADVQTAIDNPNQWLSLPYTDSDRHALYQASKYIQRMNQGVLDVRRDIDAEKLYMRFTPKELNAADTALLIQQAIAARCPDLDEHQAYYAMQMVTPIIERTADLLLANPDETAFNAAFATMIREWADR